MPATRKAFVLMGFLLAISAGLLVAGDKKSKPKNAPAGAPAQIGMDMDNGKRIVHALNRFTFGLCPGDVERVRAMGLDKWLDQQLHPERIDNSALDARLAPFRTLKMSTREMVENFPPPQVLRQVENGRMSMPSDPAKRAVYQSRIAAMREQQQKKQDANAGNTAPQPNNNQDADPKDTQSDQEMKPAAQNDAGNDPKFGAAQARRRQQLAAEMYADLASDQLLQVAPEDRYKKIMNMSPLERLDLTRQYRGPRAMQLVEGMKPEQQETIQAIMNPQLVVGGELSEAKLLRAIYSERQLEEVMTDFWYNHFNVFINKGPDRYMITAYERDVIRPHVFGKFKDLLVATAKSPAMLFYLDNWQSVGPHSQLAVFGVGNQRRQFRRGPFGMIYQVPPRPQANKNRPSGLNENYAREVMELHTLGVDGGYSQKDVTELAKVLTGWSIDKPQQGGGFRFNDRAHEPGPKYVLGHKIGDHGESEGMEMLDVLAHHPSTAKFISKKLAMRFVSDNPPQNLIDRMAQTFQEKDGDIRDVLRTMFNSPEFWSAEVYRAKVKTPLEFVTSSARASGANVQNAMPLVQLLNRMGMPLYGMQPPTGYSMKAETWVNSSALLTRMNFALQLGTGKLPGTSLDAQALLPGGAPADPGSALSALEAMILAGDVSPQTHAVMEKQLNDPQISQRKLDDGNRVPNVGAIAGLILGSPEFQRR
jgi:uncharacterized protein (DUF1800 family)